MAARKTKRLSDEHRLKIQTSQLINRLTNFVNGEVELTAPQVTAALGLLKKALPDLAATELTGADGEALFPKSIKVEKMAAVKHVSTDT